MKRSTKIITAVVLSIGVVGGAAAYGKHRFADPEARAEFVIERISDKLSLDATQEQALTVLKDELLAKRSTMKDLKPAREDLQALIEADTLDQAALLAMVTEKTQAVNAAAPDIVSALGGFLDTLNSEQKSQILTFMDEHRERGGRFGGRHGHGFKSGADE